MKTSPAEPFTDLFRSAALSFGEAHAVFENESGDEKSSDALNYALHSLITGLDRLAILTRRYSATPEYRSVVRGEHVNGFPVVADAAFRAEGEATAAKIDAGKSQLGIAGQRIAATIRRWIETQSPEQAQLLGSQVETATRVLKRKMGKTEH